MTGSTQHHQGMTQRFLNKKIREAICWLDRIRNQRLVTSTRVNLASRYFIINDINVLLKMFIIVKKLKR